MLAHHLAEKGKVLVVDADESNLGLGKMLDLSPPAQNINGYFRGQKSGRRKAHGGNKK